MTIPSGCAGWTPPEYDEADLQFGDAAPTSHDEADLQWCATVDEPPSPEPVAIVYDAQGASPAAVSDLYNTASAGGISTEQAIANSEAVAEYRTSPAPAPPDPSVPAPAPPRVTSDPAKVAEEWSEEVRRKRVSTPNPPTPVPPGARAVTPSSAQKAVVDGLRRLAELSGQAQGLRRELSMVAFNTKALRQRLTMLQGIADDPIIPAWCADFSEELAGEVATIEPTAEGWARTIIRPGYFDGAAYSASAHGQLHHRASQSPAQVYFNAAILPGVQRWRPQYRIGTLTFVDEDLDICNLSLQSEDSSANNLLIDPPNGPLALSNVPIEYMECDAEAFEAGDRVVVEFQGRDWSQPRVIGFESNPVPCLPEYIVLQTRNYNRDSATRRWFEDGTSQAYNTPLVNQIIIRTMFSHGREYVNWTMPEGFPGFSNVNLESPIDALRVSYWTTSIRWNEVIAFDEIVGGPDEKETGYYYPDEWPINHEIFVFKPEPQNLNVSFFYENSEQLVEIQVDSIQHPGAFTNSDIDRYCEVWGYDKFYRHTVSGHARWQCVGTLTDDTYQMPMPCAPDEFKRLLFVGDFALEVLEEGIEDIDELSRDEIPQTLTIKGVEYTRKDHGWRVDPINDRFRFAAFVYAREDVAGEPVEYAPGFWAED